jgi:Ca2+-transporting ATPase
MPDMSAKTVNGLTSEEARERLARTGPNRIYRPPKTSFFGIARHEVTEPMILLLFVVGFFYSLWGKTGDAVTIILIIVLLVLAEVYNEYRAKKAIASLAEVTAPRAKVLRDGSVTEVAAEEVVPEDLIVLAQGTRVAADAEVVAAMGLQIDESSLTGESLPQDKKKGNMVFAGTTALAGEGEAHVLSTGRNTRLGGIAAALDTIRPPKTVLQLAMKSLVKKLVFVAIFFSVVIPLLGLLRGQDLKLMVLTGLSLAFATIPEELPIIITMVLGLGSYRLSQKNFLVKRLQGAETLGNATVIVSDKTGTITEGKMRIVSVYPAVRKAEVLGSASGSLPEFVLSPMESEIKEAASHTSSERPLPGILRQRNLGEGGKKTKAVIRRNEGHFALYVTGAPEEVLGSCRRMDGDMRDLLAAESSKGRRVIAAARRDLLPGQETLDFADIERDMDFCGLIAFEDAPRENVAETVATAAKAGIRTIMVTGDHAMTASFIAAKVGIPAERVLEGKDLDAMTDEELREAVGEVQVFARTDPSHKYRIVKALQENGEVVAATGDGVNDVLALKGADIGIAMGLRGTDVAKDAAEAVLADDDFNTIARGIFEGRMFFDNLRKGIAYYLSVKAALIMIFLLTVLLGIAMPFSPIQIVVLELFMDLAASAGFVAEPREKNIYSRPPRNPGEKVLTAGVVARIFAGGLALFVSVAAAYFYASYRQMDLAGIQTFAFTAWIFGHIFLALVSRSESEPLLSLGVFSNPVINLWAAGAVSFLLLGIYVPLFREKLNLEAIDPAGILAIAAAALVVTGSLEIRKYLRRIPAAE